jgi:hypothetical protein
MFHGAVKGLGLWGKPHCYGAQRVLKAANAQLAQPRYLPFALIASSPQAYIDYVHHHRSDNYG